MLLDSCQGKTGSNKIEEKKCPKCGEMVEFLPGDTVAECDNCGYVIVNENMSCVRWCDKARECVGDELYEKIMEQFNAEAPVEEPTNYYGF